MAAEAASVQARESADGTGSPALTHYLLQETSLAGFLGHVQIGIARASDAQSWIRVEQPLETVWLPATPLAETLTPIATSAEHVQPVWTILLCKSCAL